MANKSLNLTADETLLIEIEFPENSKKTKSLQKSKGIIPSNKESDYQARRTKQSSMYLNIYDLGQVKDGDTWKDLDFATLANLSVSSLVDVISDLNIDGWNEYRAKILEISLADFAEKYRKFDLSLGFKYWVDIYLGNYAELDAEITAGTIDRNKYLPIARNGERNEIMTGSLVSESKWTENGLKIKEAEHFTILGLDGFPFFETANCKITSENTYASSSVDFTLDKSADLFLSPRLVLEYGKIQYSGTYGELNMLYTPFPRDLFLERTYPNFSNTIVDLTDATLGNLMKTKMLARSNARFYKNGTGWITPPNLSGATSAKLVYSGDFTRSLPTSAYIVEGSLLAMMKKGEDWFYFWSNISYAQGIQIKNEFSL